MPSDFPDRGGFSRLLGTYAMAPAAALLAIVSTWLTYDDRMIGFRPGSARIEWMPAASQARKLPRWYLVPVRVLLLTFLATLMAFALSLLFGIVGVVIRGRLGGVHPNLALAYRHIALPVAAATSLVVLIAVTVLEVRRYRQVQALRRIEEASR
ncbi:MAG TPA: hypothetical protein VMH03_03215 [Terriglobales bacterium]|nr:hypothetical protein [Terriglobales bacterium]